MVLNRPLLVVPWKCCGPVGQLQPLVYQYENNSSMLLYVIISPFNLFQHGEFSRRFGRTSDVGSLEVATPILIPRSDGHKHRKGSQGDVIFLTNRGEVTSYTPGSHGATWSNLPSPSGMMVPTLKEFSLLQQKKKKFSLRVHDNQEMILAAGEQEAGVLSPGGSVLTSVDLPAPPTHALVCVDFSNGVYGFVQTNNRGPCFLAHWSVVALWS